MLAVLCFTTYVGGYIAVQEFLLMRLYKVTRNRKKCATIVFVSLPGIPCCRVLSRDLGYRKDGWDIHTHI